MATAIGLLDVLLVLVSLLEATALPPEACARACLLVQATFPPFPRLEQRQLPVKGCLRLDARLRLEEEYSWGSQL
jgi:hypothetical protein